MVATVSWESVTEPTSMHCLSKLRASTMAALCVAGALLWPSPAGAKPKSAFELIPAEATTLIHVDLSGLRRSKLYARYLRSLGALGPGGSVSQLNGMGGFDPDRDLESMTVGVVGGLADADALKYTVLRGNFDPDVVARAVVKAGMIERQQSWGRRTFLPAATDRAGFGLVLLDKRSLLLARPPLLERFALTALARLPSAAEPRSGLHPLLAAGPKGQIFVAALGGGAQLPPLKDPSRPPEEVRASLRRQPGGLASFESLQLWLTLGAELGAAMVARAPDKKTAVKAHDGLEAALETACKDPASRPSLRRVAQAVKLSRKGKKVSAKLRVGGEDLDALLALLSLPVRAGP